MRVLVTGAAGFIGSVVTERLVHAGHDVLALDNLQHGHRAAVHRDAQFIHGDILNGAWLMQLMAEQPVDAVVHLAAEALIDESIRDPGRFFRANVCGGLNLLEAMVATGVPRLVFSSTAAVYGEPNVLPITEDHERQPVNSYGQSKLAFEHMLPWYQRAFGLKHITLRYFNACGATECFGEHHVPETHLIPVIFEAALRQRDALYVFGTDYDTPDGSCIRDYIHVSDIARAHLLAIEHVDRIGARAFNMGNGAGFSNLEVIDTVRRITGREIPVLPGDRRPGDPARLVASSERIRCELGWQPEFPDLEAMVESAWAWRLRHPKGYAS